MHAWLGLFLAICLAPEICAQTAILEMTEAAPARIGGSHGTLLGFRTAVVRGAPKAGAALLLHWKGPAPQTLTVAIVRSREHHRRRLRCATAGSGWLKMVLTQEQARALLEWQDARLFVSGTGTSVKGQFAPYLVVGKLE